MPYWLGSPERPHWRRELPASAPGRARSWASLTLRARPPKSVPFSASVARMASALAISTKPKPRGRPVSRSLIRASFSTVPCGENRARTVSSVAVKGRFPTYSLVTANYSRKKREWAGKACRLVRQTFRGGRRWPEHAPERHKAKADKPKDHEPDGRVQQLALSCRGFARCGSLSDCVCATTRVAPHGCAARLMTLMSSRRVAPATTYCNLTLEVGTQAGLIFAFRRKRFSGSNCFFRAARRGKFGP